MSSSPASSFSQNLLPQGLTTGTIAKTVEFSAAVANVSLGTIPAGSVVASVAIKWEGTLSAATATKIGVGRLTATADPDKYYLSAALTATTVTAAEEIGLFACDSNGAAAGTIGADGESVDVLITYITAETL